MGRELPPSDAYGRGLERYTTNQRFPFSSLRQKISRCLHHICSLLRNSNGHTIPTSAQSGEDAKRERKETQPCNTNNKRNLSALSGSDVHLHSDSAFSLKPPIFFLNCPNKKTTKIAKLDMAEKKTQQMWFKLCSLFLPQSILFPLGLFTICCARSSTAAKQPKLQAQGSSFPPPQPHSATISTSGATQYCPLLS